MGARHQSAKLRELKEGKGKWVQAPPCCRAKRSLPCSVLSGSPEGSGKFTVQDDRIPSDGTAKTPGVTWASPRRLDPGNGSSAWSPGGERSGSVGGDFLFACLCVSWVQRFQERTWGKRNLSCLLFVCLLSLPCKSFKWICFYFSLTVTYMSSVLWILKIWGSVRLCAASRQLHRLSSIHSVAFSWCSVLGICHFSPDYKQASGWSLISLWFTIVLRSAWMLWE